MRSSPPRGDARTTSGRRCLYGAGTGFPLVGAARSAGEHACARRAGEDGRQMLARCHESRG
jgi:hypothetical protein